MNICVEFVYFRVFFVYFVRPGRKSGPAAGRRARAAAFSAIPAPKFFSHSTNSASRLGKKPAILSSLQRFYIDFRPPFPAGL
jgi:hypothetical protein